MRIDFHVHTNLSPCSIIKPKLAVKVARKKGLDAIALVNHNKLSRFNDRNFNVILGEEVKTRQGEVIGLFIKDEIPGGLDAQKTIDLIKAQGGVAILPHAFDPLRRGVHKHVFELRNFDFLELNGRCLLKKFNSKVLSFSDKYGLPLVGGSDAHYYGEIGQVVTEVSADTIDDAMERLLYKQGRVLKKSIGPRRCGYLLNSMFMSGARKLLKY